MPETKIGEESNPASNAPAQDLKPGVAEAACDVLHDFFTNLGELRSSGERANTALILSMDRVILLAGGTLTLIFTVIGVMSPHLHETHRQVLHIPLVLAACWLLIGVIILGIFYNNSMIQLGNYQDAEQTFRMADTRLRLKLLSYPHIHDVSTIPTFPVTEDLNKKANSMRKLARILGGIVHLAFVSAFICLSLFIQSNIILMLS